jgi:protein-tyrosine phosphatase
MSRHASQWSWLGLIGLLAAACGDTHDPAASSSSARARVEVSGKPTRADGSSAEVTPPTAAKDAAVDPGDVKTTRVADAAAEPSAAGDELAPQRPVLAGHVQNARDLGGTPLADGAQVLPGMLFRGPPLANLTEQGCADAQALGIRSVIDLRIESEVELKPDADCVAERSQLVAAPLPIPYNVSAQDYIADLDASESIARVFEVLGDEASYPVYFHCTWGRDRTGILAAVILLALGATPDAIMEEYLLSRGSVGAYPMSLQAALDEIARRGGVDAYLAASGVAAESVEVLRAELSTR